MPRSKSRSRRTIDPVWPKARKAQLYRAVHRKLAQFKASREYAYLCALDAEKEKAPDPATGGFSDPAIPAQEPSSPETQALAVTPVRRAAHWTGVTVLTD